MSNYFGRKYGLRPGRGVRIFPEDSVRCEKRSKSGADAAEPRAKRAALDSLSEKLSNVNLKDEVDSPPPIGLAQSDQDVEVEDGDAPPAEKAAKPFVDPLPDYDFDAELGNDHEEVGEYAEDIFQIDREKMANYQVGLYLHVRQEGFDKFNRARLVDWLVQTQVSYELNHEQLYRAVKIFDLYVDRVQFRVERRDLHLLAGTALMMASKYDERCNHVTVKDVHALTLYHYSKATIMKAERDIFVALEFCIGAPLSYTFLRRFARVIKCDIETLTLARYILETTLLFYEIVYIKEDILAAAALYLALRMKNKRWDRRLGKYCHYTVNQVRPVMLQLNLMIHKRPSDFPMCVSIRNKYSTETYHKVASTPLLINDIDLINDLTFREDAINC